VNIIYNFTEELSKYGLTTKTYEQVCKDISDKLEGNNDLDWTEIQVKYHITCNPDTIRKASSTIFGGQFRTEYLKNQIYTNPEEFSREKELDKKIADIRKEKQKLFDQRREYNKLLVSDARAEHLNDELLSIAENLNKEYPLVQLEEYKPVNTKREALLALSDWHYGMVTDNIWNTYNTDICKKRVEKLVSKVIEYLKLNQIDMLHIALLGDAAHGGCHVSCRVKSEEDTCDQIMHVSEIMAEAINKLSMYVNHITVYSCYGNHLRTIQNKQDSVDSDNLEKLIPWWLKQRLKENTKIDIVESEYKEFTRINVCGYKICCVHGNLDNFKNIGSTVNTIFSRKFGETIDYTISGDKHHLEEFEQFDIESVLIRSLCGTDDYANEKRLYSKPGQTLMIFNLEDGRESTYHIPLN
jgi:hypothetical protein